MTDDPWDLGPLRTTPFDVDRARERAARSMRRDEDADPTWSSKWIKREEVDGR